MGKLIAIDGLDGSGKRRRVIFYVTVSAIGGIRVRELSFPVYESESSALARLYLEKRRSWQKPDDTNAYAASMFFAANRYVTYQS